MIPSAHIVEFVAGWESLRLIAYAATEDERRRGIWTIGYGRTQGVRQGDTCSPAEAQAWLAGTLDGYGTALLRFMTRDPAQQQLDALLSLSFNAGVENVGTAGIMSLFNAGDDIGCADRLLQWNKQGGVVLRGLTKRRTAERNIYLFGDYDGRP